MTTPTPTPPNGSSARARYELNRLIAELARNMQAADDIDLDAVAELSKLVANFAVLTQAQADHLNAVNARHAAQREAQ
ncbi:hypothetical protein [Streptomyces sp. NPDC002758]